MEAILNGVSAALGGGFVGWLVKLLIERTLRRFDAMEQKVADIEKAMGKLAETVQDVQTTLENIQDLLTAMTVEEERRNVHPDQIH
jgi:hypothetical protein